MSTSKPILLTDNAASYYPAYQSILLSFRARGKTSQAFLAHIDPLKTYESLSAQIDVDFPDPPFNGNNAPLRAAERSKLDARFEAMTVDIKSHISEKGLLTGLGSLTNNKPFALENVDGSPYDPFIFLRDLIAAIRAAPSRVSSAIDAKIPQLKNEGPRGVTRSAEVLKVYFAYKLFVNSPVPQGTQLDLWLELFPPAERGLRRITFNQMLLANANLTVVDFMNAMMAEDAITFPDTQPENIARDIVNLFIPGASLRLMDQLADSMSAFAVSTSTTRASTEFRYELCPPCTSFAKKAQSSTNKSAMMMVPCSEPGCNGKRKLNPNDNCLVHPNATPRHKNNECTSTGNLAATFIKTSSVKNANIVSDQSTSSPSLDSLCLFDSCAQPNLVDENQAKILGVPGSIEQQIPPTLVGGVAGQVLCTTRITLKASGFTALVMPTGLHLDYPIISEASVRKLGWTRNELSTGPALTHKSQAPVKLHILNENLFVNYRELFPRA